MKESPQLIDACVLIATRDRPSALSRCVAALLDGEALPREVVIVDQGIARAELESDRTKIHVIPDDGDGLSRARNVGLRAVTQPIVAVLDDDCVPSPSWLAALSRAVRNADAVTGRVLPLPAVGQAVFAVSSRTSDRFRVFTHTTAPWHVGTGGNFAARTEILRRLGGYDERLGAGTPAAAGEDIDLIHRLLRAGARIRYDPQVLVYHARVDAHRRRATRATYGRGMGVFIGLRLRRGELHAIPILGRWAVDRSSLIARAFVRLDRQAIAEELSVMHGTVRGLAQGLRATRSSQARTAPERS